VEFYVSRGRWVLVTRAAGGWCKVEGRVIGPMEVECWEGLTTAKTGMEGRRGTQCRVAPTYKRAHALGLQSLPMCTSCKDDSCLK
jgi:hypothetical protein